MRDNLSLTLHLIRHGRTAKNASMVEIGQTADEPLDEEGEQQAKLLGERLRKEVVFDSIYCSSMTRAQQTLKLAEPKVNGTVNNSVDELVEIYQGDAQGRPRTDFFPDIQSWERFKRNGMGFTFPNSESQFDVETRVWNWLNKEVLTNTHTRTDKALQIGVFSHGMSLKCLLHKIMDFDHKLTGRIDLANTSISKVHLKNGDWFVDCINDTAHLNNQQAKRLLIEKIIKPELCEECHHLLADHYKPSPFRDGQCQWMGCFCNLAAAKEEEERMVWLRENGFIE